MLIPKFQVGHFLTLSSAAAFAACAFQGCGSCFQLGTGTGDASVVLWAAAARYTVFSADLVIQFSPFCAFFIFFKSILPFSLFFSSLFTNECPSAWVLCTARPWSRMSHEWQSSCHTDWPINPGLVWGLEPASDRIVLLKLLLATSPQPPALCLATSEVLLPFAWFRIKRVSFLAFPYPLSWLTWNRNDLWLVWK